MQSGSLIALDIETTGLDPFHDKILLIQLGTRTKRLVIDYRKLGDEIQQLNVLLSSKRFAKLGYNLAFDCAFLEVNGLQVRGPLVDVYLGSKVDTAGLPERKGMNGLAACAKRLLGVDLSKEQQTSFIDFDGEFDEEQLQYSADDVGEVLFDLNDAMKKLLAGQNIIHIWRLECRALPVIIQMYVNGMKLDISYYRELLTSEAEFREEKKIEVIRHLDEHGVLDDYKCPLTGDLLMHPNYSGRGKGKTKGFNLGSPAQLGVALAEYGVPLKKKVDEETGKISYSCDKNIIAFHLADFKVLQLYKEFKEAATACSYVEKLIGFAEKSPDGRIHARYNQMVRTGRMSCMDPNLQAIKKGKKHRKGFIAEINRILCVADYSQLELRLVTEVSGDEKLIKIYEEGLDVHTASAALMTGVPIEEVTKEARQAAKVFNFSCLYGAGAKTVRKQAVAQFGLMWTLEEVTEKLRSWKDAYPGLIKWQRSQGNSEELEVFTRYGRRRILQYPKKGESNFTTNLNTPIQGLGADCMKAAMALLWERHLADDPEIKVCACVHDELILECPSNRAEEAQQILKQCMEDAAPLIGIKTVPIVAEPSSGTDWSAK